MKKKVVSFLVLISFVLLISCSGRKNNEKSQKEINFSGKLTEPASVYTLLDINNNEVIYPMEEDFNGYRLKNISNLPENTTVRLYPDRLYMSKNNYDLFIYISVKKIEGWIPIQKFILPDNFLDNLFVVLPIYKDIYSFDQVAIIFERFIIEQFDSIDQDYFSSLIEKYYNSNKQKLNIIDIYLIDSLLSLVKVNTNAKTNPLSYQIKYTYSFNFWNITRDYEKKNMVLLDYLLNFRGGPFKNTPLIEAILCDNYEAVDYLLANNCDVKYVNALSKTAFDYANECQNENIKQIINNSSTTDMFSDILEYLTKDVNVTTSSDLSLSTEISPGVSVTLSKQKDLENDVIALRETKMYHSDNSVTTIPLGEEVDIIHPVDDKYIKIDSKRSIYKYYIAKYNKKYGIICGEDFSNSDFYHYNGNSYMIQQFDYDNANDNVDVYRFNEESKEIKKITFNNIINYSSGSYTFYSTDSIAVHEDEKLLINTDESFIINNEKYNLMSIVVYDKDYEIMQDLKLYFVSEDGSAFEVYDAKDDFPSYKDKLTYFDINIKDIQFSDDKLTLKIKFYEKFNNELEENLYLILSSSQDNSLRLNKIDSYSDNENFSTLLFQSYIDSCDFSQ